MIVNKDGKVKDYEIAPSVIVSDARMTYDDVQEIIDGNQKLIKNIITQLIRQIISFLFLKLFFKFNMKINAINQKPKIWKLLNALVSIKEYLKDAKYSLVLTSKVNNGFAIESKRKIIGSFNIGMSAKIELKKPTKLKIPIKGIMQMFASMLKGAMLLK